MRLTYDAVADAAYIYLEDPVAPGAAAKTVVCDVYLEQGLIDLDFDSSGRLIGIEILGASRVLPPSVLDGFG